MNNLLQLISKHTDVIKNITIVKNKKVDLYRISNYYNIVSEFIKIEGVIKIADIDNITVKMGNWAWSCKICDKAYSYNFTVGAKYPEGDTMICQHCRSTYYDILFVITKYVFMTTRRLCDNKIIDSDCRNIILSMLKNIDLNSPFTTF